MQSTIPGNSVGEAVAAACPLVVVPLNTDQYFWAERVCALGIGLQLDKLAVAAHDFRQAFTCVLDGTEYAINVQKLSCGVSTTYSAEDQALAHIERLAGCSPIQNA